MPVRGSAPICRVDVVGVDLVGVRIPVQGGERLAAGSTGRQSPTASSTRAEHGRMTAVSESGRRIRTSSTLHSKAVVRRYRRLVALHVIRHSC
jgi:hypothetical protein